MENVDIYLILLLAIIAGWLLGRYSAGMTGKRSESGESTDWFEDYFVGLNYLLNDEPDEAIDTFIKALEINSETIETHLALGALLRRRGKVDKAIKVHQSLLARPGLQQNFSDSTRLQLSLDYIAAGLLDRAERLLNELREGKSPARWEALQHLITIYQIEKEWEKAIACCQILLASNDFKKNKEIRTAAANYCCELADQQLESSSYNAARDQARRAFTFSRKNLRASLILAKVDQQLGNYRAAIKELVRIKNNEPSFLGELLPVLQDCYSKLDALGDYQTLLAEALTQHPSPVVVIALARLIREQQGHQPALDFLLQQQRQQPSIAGLIESLRLQSLSAKPELAENLELLITTMELAEQQKPAYRCSHCGFQSRSLFWLCPSCQKWDKISPVKRMLSVEPVIERSNRNQ